MKVRLAMEPHTGFSATRHYCEPRRTTSPGNALIPFTPHAMTVCDDYSGVGCHVRRLALIMEREDMITDPRFSSAVANRKRRGM